MLNHITIQGRLTKDVELRLTPNGVSVATFCLAVDRDYDRQQTDFVNVVAWRQTAEFVDKYFSKGQMMVADGRLQIRDWTDKHGDRRTVAEVVAEHVYFCGDTRKSESTDLRHAEPAEPHTAFQEADDTDDGELPF